MIKTRRQKLAGPRLVINHGPAKGQFLTLHRSVKSAAVRNDTMEGRPYLVVPVVMILEGVHTGNNGPLYYPREELAKTPEVWNHKPVVVYHPKNSDGKGIGACHPDILTTHKIGVIMNTKFDGMGRLLAEAWLDVARVKKVDDRILKAIEEKKILELSTGLFSDNEETEGEWEGERYHSIARNYRPDHLAILPDQVGACSVADGAGFLRNEAQKGELCAQLEEALQARVEYISHEAGECVYLKGGKRFRCSFSTLEDGSVKLDSDTTKEVDRITEYRTVGSPEGNAAERQPKQTEPKMNKKELVDGLIANGGYSEDDRETLMGLSEAVLKGMKAATEKVVANAKKVEPTKQEPAKQDPTPPKAPATHAEFLSSAPAETRAIIQNAERVLVREKEKHVAIITANKRNKFTKEQLMTKSIEELELLSELAAEPVANDDQGESSFHQPMFLGNGAHVGTGEGKPEDPLGLPVMDFSRK